MVKVLKDLRGLTELEEKEQYLDLIMLIADQILGKRKEVIIHLQTPLIEDQLIKSLMFIKHLKYIVQQHNLIINKAI